MLFSSLGRAFPLWLGFTDGSNETRCRSLSGAGPAVPRGPGLGSVPGRCRAGERVPAAVGRDGAGRRRARLLPHTSKTQTNPVLPPALLEELEK